ncbi:hypothetical protein TWF481_007732 [Arthrobotrys musiformis]|uniref:Uncharacterized protein n=1 Tax=Arthrobotrys musiformis TaxID=47236 RepID=A0AAV9WCK6_9PEZI
MLSPNSIFVTFLMASPFASALYIKTPVNDTVSTVPTTSAVPIVERQVAGLKDLPIIGGILNATKGDDVPAPVALDVTSNPSTLLTVLTTTSLEPTAILADAAATGERRIPVQILPGNTRAGDGVLLRTINVFIRRAFGLPGIGDQVQPALEQLPPIDVLPEIIAPTTSVSEPVPTASEFPQLVIRQDDADDAGDLDDRDILNSTIIARDLTNSTIIARDLTNSTIVARDNSTIAARGVHKIGDQYIPTVAVPDNSTIVARDNSTIAARGIDRIGGQYVPDNSTIVARDTIVTPDNSTIIARDNSTAITEGL